MLIGVVQEKFQADMLRLAQNIDTSLFEALELRLDACEDLDVDALSKISLPLPAIFTLRKKDEGGAFVRDEASRLNLLEKLAALNPSWLDLEASLPKDYILHIKALAPRTRIILSQHNFSETPQDLDAVLAAMRQKAEGVIYKIANYAKNSLDTLRMLIFCKKWRERGIDLIGISMGEEGATSRILAPVINFGFSYCPVNKISAPGQIEARVLCEDYNFKALNKDTAVYGLIGDPVLQSVGHLYHNRRNLKAGINSVYVKWRIARDDTEEALRLLHELGVKGLSVTMPLKEAVMPFLSGKDEYLEIIGAANTLKYMSTGWQAKNTDGAGALASLPPRFHDLKDKKLLLLGAGGASRAIICEALRIGAKLKIYNRTTRNIAGLTTLSLDEVKNLTHDPYDIIINTLPFDVDFSFENVPFFANALAFDCSYGNESPFLSRAKEAGCMIMDGKPMFEAQAALQRNYWGLPDWPW